VRVLIVDVLCCLENIVHSNFDRRKMGDVIKGIESRTGQMPFVCWYFVISLGSTPTLYVRSIKQKMKMTKTDAKKIGSKILLMDDGCGMMDGVLTHNFSSVGIHCQQTTIS